MPINHLISSFNGDLRGTVGTIRLWISSKQSRRKHVFVAGFPRSGTTLLKTILVSHSKMHGLNYETSGILYTIRNLRNLSLAELNAKSSRSLFHDSSSIVDFYDQTIEQICPPDLTFVDKSSPRPIIFRKLINIFPNSQFLITIRDPRDCYCSARRHNHVYQAGNNAGKYANYWEKMAKSLLKISAHPNVKIIKYEDLVEIPENTIAKVMEWLGYDFEPSQLDFESFSRVTSLGSSKNHQNIGKTITPRSVGRWRAELNEKEEECFSKIANTLLHAGYSK